MGLADSSSASNTYASAYTSPSESSSPSLPPLPRLPRTSFERSTQFSSPPQQKSDSTYYTALWGSPYELPSSSKASQGNKVFRRRNTASSTDGSPLRPSKAAVFGNGETRDTENARFLRRSYTSEGTQSIPFSRIDNLQSAQRTYDLTGDWIRNYTREKVEKRTWLSDESDNSSSGSDWREVEALVDGFLDQRFQAEPKTPKASQLNRHVLPARPANSTRNSFKRGHRTRTDNGTLTQQDFDDLLKTEPERVSQGPKMLSALMSGAVTRGSRRSPAEKPLPPAPVRTASEAPVITSNSMNVDPSVQPQRPSIASTSSFQRPRKKTQWRGKVCVIALPLEIGTDTDGKPKVLLKPEEVTARMQRWEREGFSNRGFDLLDDSTGRAIYPDADEYRTEVQSRNFTVNIPNKKASDDYLKQLKEEKLQALLARIGEDEPARSSPGVSSMSRQPSSQNSFAPSLSNGPLVGSQFSGQIENAFSPPLTAPHPQFPFIQPMISPGAIPPNPRSAGFHLPNQSMAFPPGQMPSHNARFQAQQTPLLPGMQPQQHYLGSLPNSRGVSPLVDGRRHSIRISNSPVSPLPGLGVDGYFNGLAQHPPHLRQQAGQIYPALMQQQAIQHQKPNLQRQATNDLSPQHPIRYVSQPDIASPVPQGHRHNLSENLQKEIDNAEYHLEESIARQLEDEEDSSPSLKKNKEADSVVKQDSVSEVESQDLKATASDIETNPSLMNSPIVGSAGLPASGAHTPKTSGSKLNVKAQEFIFDPSRSSFTSALTFGDQASTTSGPTSATSTSGFAEGHGKTTSNTSAFSSSLNVAAPAFVPTKLQAQPPLTSNRVFSFSASLPGSKPSALSSTPGYAFTSNLNDESEKEPQAPGIFADVVQPPKESKAIPIVPPKEDSDHAEDESGRIGPAADRRKRMRRGSISGNGIPLFAAMLTEIPSVTDTKPQETAGKEVEEDKEEQVRKRETPTISTSEPATLGSPARQTVEEPLNTADFLEAPTIPATPSSSAEQATDQLKALVDNIDVLEGGKSGEVPQVRGPIEDPFAVGDHDDAGATDKSRPQSPSASPKAIAEERLEAISNGVSPSLGEEAASEVLEPTKESASSATANSFAFNPAVIAFEPPNPAAETSSSTPVATESSAKTVTKKPGVLGGLGASRYATQEPLQPLREPSPPPARKSPPEQLTSSTEEFTVKPSQEPSVEERREPFIVSSAEISPKGGSPMNPRPDSPIETLDDRIISGVQYVEPSSYQEIDDVIKQLNGDDSDAGVERNPVEAWRSPVRRATDEHQYAPSHELVQREYLSDADRRLQRSPFSVTASPNRYSQPFQYLPAEAVEMSDSAADAAAEMIARNPRSSPSFKKPRHPSASFDSPVRRLNRNDNGSISDWDDVVSSGEEEAFNTRVGFFDNRISHVIANALEDRLQPLETALATLTAELARKSNRSRSRRHYGSVSADVQNSDADDEDEEMLPGRAISPLLKDRKVEKLRCLLMEAVNSQRSVAVDDTTRVLEALAELKTAINHQQQEPETSTSGMGNEAIAKITEAIGELKSSLGKVEQPSQAAVSAALSSEEMVNMTNAIARLQTSINEQKERAGSSHDIKTVVEEAINKHMRGKSAPVTSSQAGAAVEKLQLQVNGLESMLKIQESRANDEYKQRRKIEDELVESRRELENAVTEAAENREIAEETEASLRSFLDDQQQNKQHMVLLEEAQVSMERTISDLTEKNLALEETISEYRISHHDWRTEMNEAKTTNEDLERTIVALREELEDDIKSKQNLKEKFERIQEDMTRTTQSIAKDQASWRHKEEEHKAKHELSLARLEAEARTRERLELEIERLEKQEREAMRSRFLVEQVRNENNNLSNIVNDLRTKNHQHQERCMAFERELHDTKERAHLEIQRISNLTKGDVEAANQQLQIQKSDLESVIKRLESQLENTRNDTKLVTDRYELMLEEASVSKNNALREAAEAREAALQEHYRFHERTLGEATSSHDRAMNELKSSYEQTIDNAVHDHTRAVENLIEDHKRALRSVSEEKRISEQESNGRLSLSDEKILHLQDKVTHLEERLEIAKSAAQAAAEAARSARSSTPQQQAQSVSRSAMPSMVATRNSQIPDKISPQALRESILVLQEQLHERESRIEKLEQELAAIDQEAPQKVKERDIEIAWLRELLGVRLDDLQDIITALSAPAFDRDAVRDAAIRLRANLQMEQQEKERAVTGAGAGQRLPSLSTIAASPRSLPLAAAAAWGNWRKGQTSLSSLAEMAVPSASSSAAQTPSKSSPQSFLSGLLTPPHTTVRHTPQPRASATRHQTSTQRRPLSGYSTPKRQLSSSGSDARRLLAQGNLLPPETPPLLRQQSYDADAAENNHHYSLESYVTDPPVDGEVDVIEDVSEASDGLGRRVEEKGKERVGDSSRQSRGTARGDERRMDADGGSQELFGPSIELES